MNLGNLAASALVAVLAVLAPSCADASDRRPTLRSESVMVFGDSFVEGIGTSDPATKSFASQAGVRSHGIMGSTTSGLRSWWTADLTAMDRPTVAVLHIGMNDLIRGASARETIAALRGLKREGRSHGVRVVFGTLVPFEEASPWRAQYDGQRRVVNNWIRNRATFVELAAPLNCGTAEAEFLCAEYVGSWNDLHPNDAGAAVVAANLRAWVRADSALAGPRR